MSDLNWKSIAASFADKIESGELVPGERLRSGDALARELNVNRNTVHRAFEELCRWGLVVRRQGSGTYVAERASKGVGRIALLFDGYDTIHNFPSADLLQGIQDRIGEDVALVLTDSKQDPALEARQLRKLAKQADGVMLYICDADRVETLKGFVDKGYPVVAIDRIPHGVPVDSVVTENYGAVTKAIAELQQSGHRRIGFLGIPKPGFSSVTERYEGYRDAMVEAGLDPEDLLRWLPLAVGVPQKVFERFVRDTILGMRHGSDPMTALFCVEDCIACAAVRACDELGVGIPSDLEIATFNDWHPLELLRPWNIRRIVQRKYETGRAAAGLLLERIASPELAPRTLRIEADIVTTDASFREPASLPLSNL